MRFRGSDVQHDTREEGGFGRGDLVHLPTKITVVYSWAYPVERASKLKEAYEELKRRVLAEPGSPPRYA